MIRVNTLLILTFMCMPVMAEQWHVDTHYKEINKVTIRYGGAGYSVFTKAMDSIAPNKTLVSINLRRLVRLNSDGLQKDILKYLETHNPKELEDALTSSGNLHTQKIAGLRKPFREAVLNTGFIKNINRILKTYGYKIKDISFEKFFIIKKPESINFDAMTWLKIEKLPGLTNKNGSK